jgi:2-desacetyl-2-hydroxyethyl bacteriochlorophyllide A dehydrogenase
MKATHAAVVISGPRRAALTRRPTPMPRRDEVLVRTAWQGICATDREIYEGTLGYYKTGLAKYPIVPGHEMSGVVAAVGPSVRGLRPGQHVVVECIQGCGRCAPCRGDNAIGCKKRRELGVVNLDGGYGEFVLTAARFVHIVPAGVSLRDASLAEPLAVCCKGLRRLSAAWGPGHHPRKIAVIGAGAIGLLSALALKLEGHSSVVFDSNLNRRKTAAEAGLPARSALKGLAEFDALIEATGNPDALHTAIAGARAGATLLLLGFPYDKRGFSFESLVGYDKTLVGSVGSSPRDFDKALSLLRSLDTRPFLGGEFPLRDYARAWAAARAKGCLKAVLNMGGADR